MKSMPDPVAPKSRVRVILVEREPQLSRLIHYVLNRAGYEVVPTRGIREALQVLASSEDTVKVLMADGTAGDLDTLSSTHPEVRMLVIWPAPEQRPGTAYLPVPFTPAQLERAVRKLVAK